jgi:hypothetical protein
MLLIPAVLIVGGILALVLYLEKASPPYQPFDALQDEFYRDFATHQLIDACMVAGEEPLARALLVSIRDGFVRDEHGGGLANTRRAPGSSGLPR